MGGGITGSKGNPGSNKRLEKQSTELFDLIKPLLEQSSSGVSDILRTGGTNALIPSIQRSVEASGKATSEARTRTSEDLTRQGVTGTDYNSIISNLLQQGEFNTSQIPGNFYQDIIKAFYTGLTGLPNTALQGQSNAAANATNINAANTAAAQQFVNNIQTAGGATSGSGGAAVTAFT